MLDNKETEEIITTEETTADKRTEKKADKKAAGNKAIGVIFVILVVLFTLITCNYTKRSSHEVLTNYYEADAVAGYKGYEFTDEGFKIIDEDEHYCTFSFNTYANEFFVLFKNSFTKDMDATVWYMHNDGEVISETTAKISKGDRYIFLEEVPVGTSLIALQIDEDFSICEAISSTYSDGLVRKIVFLSIGLVLSLLVSILLVTKTRLTAKIEEAWKGFSKDLSIKRVIINTLILVVSIIVSYHLKQNINIKAWVLLAAVIYVAVFGILNYGRILRHIEFYSCLLIFIIGSLYSVLEPYSVGVSWDDQIHFGSALEPLDALENKEYNSRVILDGNLLAVANDKLTFDRESATYTYETYDILYDFGFHWKPEKRALKYSYLIYSTMTVGIAFARGLQLPFHVCVFFGRWFNVLFFTIMCYICMKKLKSGKLALLLFMLIPTNIFIVGTYNYDTWLNAWSMLGFSLLFSEFLDKEHKMSTKVLILIPLSFFLAVLLKQVYFILIFPAFFLGKDKFETPKKKWIYRLLLSIAIILPFILIMVNHVFNPEAGDKRGGSDVSATGQIDYILGNFGVFMGNYIKYLKFLINPFRAGGGYTTAIGYNGQYLVLKHVLLIVIIGCLLDNIPMKKGFPWWYRLGMLVVYIGIAAIVAVSMYISFTPVGADYFNGVQGRYLTSSLFPTAYVLSRFRVLDIKPLLRLLDIKYLVFGLIMLGLNAYCIWQGCVVLY